MSAEQVKVLFDRCSKLARSDFSWASEAKQITDEGVPYSSESEEYAQVLRVRFGVDELIATLGDVSDLGVSQLVELYWSLARCRVWSEVLVTQLQNLISKFIDSISPKDAVLFLWAEAMFFGPTSQLEIEVNWADFSLIDITNVIFAYSLMKKRADIVREGRNLLLTRNAHSPHGIRAVVFANHFLGDTHVPTGIKQNDKPSWRYTFELCLACQGLGGKVDVLPVIENVFPFDALYKTRGKKILFDLVRPQAVIRDLKSGCVVNVDGYTAMSRQILAEKGYRIIAISTTEWTNLKGRQVGYLKRRIRNCLDKQNLFSGPEKEVETDENSSDSDTGSDMSY